MKLVLTELALRVLFSAFLLSLVVPVMLGPRWTIRQVARLFEEVNHAV